MGADCHRGSRGYKPHRRPRCENDTLRLGGDFQPLENHPRYSKDAILEEETVMEEKQSNNKKKQQMMLLLL
jgi:hypothetical protein